MLCIKNLIQFIRPNYVKFLASYTAKLKTMKINSSEFEGIMTPGLKRLVSLFDKYNYEIRIAGGAVRDILSGIHPHDVDFATTATPDEMKKIFEEENVRMINSNGEKHGTITARIDEQNYEVTTLRIDVVTDGRHAKVKFTKDWLLDSNRRDLTINSMFLGPDGVLYDYFNGYDDLTNHRVLFVGDAATRIQEDYLRILRYFRFYGRVAKKPDNHDDDTIKAIKNNIHGLQRISGERIWTELNKILIGNFAGDLLPKVFECGAFPYIGLPETPNLKQYSSLIKTLNGSKVNAIALIVGLLDSKDELLQFRSRCKLSNFERELGLFLLNYRKDKHNSLQPYKKLLFSTEGKVNDSTKFVTELLTYQGNLELKKEFENWIPPKFPINGYVLSNYNIPRGKQMGIVLKHLKDYWIEKEFAPNEEELRSIIPNIIEQLPSRKK